MPRESWVRPPVVPTEAPSKAFANWRYRVVAAVLLIVVAYVFVKLFLQFSDVTGGEDPGIGISRLERSPVSAAR
jgi:hypothetical protein